MSRWHRPTAFRNALPLLLVVSLGFLVVLTACHPGSIENVEETDIVATNYDNEADFGQLRTYALDPEVEEARDPDSNDPEYDGRYDATILGKIRSNMNALDYDEVDFNSIDPDDQGTWPDMLVRAVVTYATNWVVYTYYPGYPGWGWGWGWYYPWPATGAYSFRSGTVFVDMYDLTQAEEVAPDSMVVPVVWNGILNGVAEGSTSLAESRISESIDQMYRQSPYLGYQGN